MGVDIRIADVPLSIIVGTVVEVGLDFHLADSLLGDIGKELLLDLIPVDQSQRLVFLVLRHKGAGESDDLAH